MLKALSATSSGGFTPPATSTTWVPVDASGAGLTITNATSKYLTVGPFVFITGSCTYPSTADASSAALGGLPTAILNSGGAGGAFTIYDGTAAILLGFPTINTTTFSIVSVAGIPVTNVTLSGKALRFQFFYPTA